MERHAGPPGEPFVHGYVWVVILKDMLFPQGEGGGKGGIEAIFFGHGEVIVCFRRICNGLHSQSRGQVGGASGTLLSIYLI